MTFFDIGANQGFYTLLAAKCVGGEGKVFAFEPVSREFRNLKWNVLINRFKNVKIEPIREPNNGDTLLSRL
jgi:FkbM family methyltransferase